MRMQNGTNYCNCEFETFNKLINYTWNCFLSIVFLLFIKFTIYSLHFQSQYSQVNLNLFFLINQVSSLLSRTINDHLISPCKIPRGKSKLFLDELEILVLLKRGPNVTPSLYLGRFLALFAWSRRPMCITTDSLGSFTCAVHKLHNLIS